ncbi:hypothetical protein X781_8850 [Mannheimia sp. USDA-ARS-USMARC-1261]|nr:hypothetical protein X781_8850 [Mannheimia sp. USDA-ARS-USMARC-1261]
MKAVKFVIFFANLTACILCYSYIGTEVELPAPTGTTTA